MSSQIAYNPAGLPDPEDRPVPTGFPAHLGASRGGAQGYPEPGRDLQAHAPGRPVLQVLRHRPGHLHLPRQLHPHPLQLRLRRQRPGPGPVRPGRAEEPGGPRRDRARDRQHDQLPHRGHRHPRRHVPGRGPHLHAGSGRTPSPTAPSTACCTAAPASSTCSATSTTRPRPWPTCAWLKRALRQRGGPQGQEDRHDLGLLPQLRQAPVRAPGHHRPHDPVRHGRPPGPPQGLRPHPRGGGAGRQAGRPVRRQVPGDQQHGRGLRRRRHRLPQVLGPVPRHGAAHPELLKLSRTRPDSSTWSRTAWPTTPSHSDWECTRAKMDLTAGRQGALHALPARRHHRRELRQGREVSAEVFEQYRIPTYHEASYKPFVISALMFLTRMQDPAARLETLVNRAQNLSPVTDREPPDVQNRQDLQRRSGQTHREALQGTGNHHPYLQAQMRQPETAPKASRPG
jgi:hypothetical protein